MPLHLVRGFYLSIHFQFFPELPVSWAFFLGCSQSLLEMGTGDLDFVQLSQLIGRKTGGISVYPSTSSVRGKAEPSSHIIIRGKAMASQTSDLFELVRT